MTSLTDVYERGVGVVTTRRRLYVGLSLFALGALAVVAGIVVATTGVADRFGLGTFAARELAGVLAGLGVPAALIGSFALFPASKRTRAGALIGVSLSVLGVTLFRFAYPRHWVGSSVTPHYTLPVVVVYFVGAITTFWCLFVAVARFKTRNDPGGTVRMEVTESGATRILEVSGSVPGLGSVGLFGDAPDGDVGTQTNRDEVLYEREGPAGDAAPASDGGSAAEHTPTDAADPSPEAVEQAAAARGQPDAYCGNCEHFQYVRVDGEMHPGCTLHKEVLDDMDACEEWQANN